MGGIWDDWRRSRKTDNCNIILLSRRSVPQDSLITWSTSRVLRFSHLSPRPSLPVLCSGLRHLRTFSLHVEMLAISSTDALEGSLSSCFLQLPYRLRAFLNVISFQLRMQLGLCHLISSQSLVLLIIFF